MSNGDNIQWHPFLVMMFGAAKLLIFILILAYMISEILEKVGFV